MGRLKEIKDRLEKAMPITGSMNYPFYGHLKRPRASLSKHDKGHSCNLWHVDDVRFLVGAYEDVKFLLEELEKYDKK